jgi:hypothetical protein
VTVDPAVVIGAMGAVIAAVSAALRMIYIDLRRDRDYWRDAYFQAMGVNDKAIEVADRVARRA